MTIQDHRLFPFRSRPTLSRHGSGTFLALERSLTGIPDSTASSDVESELDEDLFRTGPLGLSQLSDPAEPLVELVFVHGLGGGSRRSWSKSSSETHFWPKSWLSRDPSFHNVRIHSFGYKSAKTEVHRAITGIPDYAQSLLSALHDSPAIRRNDSVIVLVGHSMGGLVIKKAFIQAHAVEAYKLLAVRIRSLYFLGTPHQGSDFVSTFVSYFKGVPFVRATENAKDLDPSSRLIEVLNQEFPRYSQNVELRSFWETEQSKVMGKHQFVVPKHSACLNYTNEITDGIDADHRGICKFDRPTNPNFQKLRNALATTIDTLVCQHETRNDVDNAEHLRMLAEFLGIKELPEDDLAEHLTSCLPGDTCAWFTTRQDFQDWRDSGTSNSSTRSRLNDLVLVEAEPGTGKSVLSAQVVKNLLALNYECSYYFFDAQNRGKSSLSRMFRSLALQMAMLDVGVRQRALELRKQITAVHEDNDKSVWRKLFVTCIFQLASTKRHFWVIDGIDECQQYLNLLQMLLRLPSGVHPKIFLTSRPTGGSFNDVFSHQGQISRLRISNVDTSESIRTYVETRVSALRVRKNEDRSGLIKALLDGADGSFLWVKLTLDDMSRATGPQQVMDSLSQLPKAMDHLYRKILHDIEAEISDDQMPIVKSVIDWVTCANPPLSIEELEAVVKLDTGSDVFADKMCEVLRNLLIIDRSGKVRPIHQTARTYLLGLNSDSALAVSAPETHARIAEVLISHLHQRLRNIRTSSQLVSWHERKQGIDNYALVHFSEHVRRAGPHDHNIFVESERFFSHCGPSWIASIALDGSLSPIVKTSQNLRNWLQARIKRTPSIGDLARKTIKMQQWSVDLSRLVAKFGRHLLTSPFAIYTTVPLFVPKESVLAISRPRPRDLSVVGLANDKWDDRFCSKYYQNSSCSAVASGKYNFAIATKNGKIYIYDNNTMQLLRTLECGAVVKLLKYNEEGSRLLTGGFRRLRVWTIPDGTLLWDEPIRGPRLAAEFIGPEVLMSISSQHQIIKQNAISGQLLQVIDRRGSIVDGDESGDIFRRELQYAEFSKEAEMLATMQRERPIQLTDIEDRYEIGVIELDLSDDGCQDATEQPITTMTFCANIDIALLAALYRDGILAVFDRDLRVMAKRVDNQGCTLLAGSPNGLLLAAANVEGIITLYSFEELTPLHRLHTQGIENIRSLVFSGDGQSIVDIRDRQANVWTPAVLASRSTEDFDSISESTLAPTVVTSTFAGSKDTFSDITCMLSCPKSDQVFLGREDGSVEIYSTKDAKVLQAIAQDPTKQWVAGLTWKSKGKTLVSQHGSTHLAIHFLQTDWTVSAVLRQALANPVKQVFTNEQDDGLKVFIVTTKTIELWTIFNSGTGKCVLNDRQTRALQCDGVWVQDAFGHLILAETNGISTFRWDDITLPDWSRQLSFQDPELGSDPNINRQQEGKIATLDRGATLLTAGRPTLLLRSVSSQDITQISPSAATPAASRDRRRWIVDLSAGIAPPTQLANSALVASSLPISELIEHIIGIRDAGKQILFLSKGLWVCSYECTNSVPTGGRRPSSATTPEPTQLPSVYTRHFFIPDDWISSNYSNANGQLLFVVAGTKEDCLVFAKKHEIAVIKNPFAVAEKVKI